MLKKIIVLLVVAFLSGCENFPQPNVKIIAFGDSATLEYPNYLPQYLPVSDKEIGKMGKGGETTSEGLERLNGYIKFNTFPNGNIFLYWEGGNDLIDLISKLDPMLILSPIDPTYPFKSPLNIELNKIKTNIGKAVDIAHSQGWNVYMATYQDLMPINCPAIPIKILLPKQAAIANEYQFLLNQSIKEVAISKGILFVDIGSYNFLISQYKNCNHLNSSGNQIVAKMWADKIK